MKTLLAAIPVSLMLAMSAQANSQLNENEFEIMKVCHVNATAMNLYGGVREHYLNNCVLSRASEDNQPHMRKACQINATAMNLAGDVRRNYLLSCLASN
ncbi:hypothetical protein LG201_11705 [Methylobacillus gramineus]|uniref:hypothetical protein n=1 Tax=Methylobacillus gramineus TaxID=755169 RepID=UPI001CFF615C|nr:hypothetical protein [Methylobacillus gramineus]MCB5185868.1 hypothetical protein [Methylobacillus gramineus]